MTGARLGLDDPAVRQLVDTFDRTRQQHWRLDRSAYAPQVLSSTDDDVTLWALVTRRPYTAAHKVADIAVTRASSRRGDARHPDVPDHLVGSLLQEVADACPDHAVTRVEAHGWLADSLPHLGDVLTRLGFVRSRPPLASIPSTMSDLAAWTRWVVPPGSTPAELPPFMGQTTDFTCGAVSLITALHGPGRSVLSDPTDRVSNRRDELRWWRKATNMPACDPLTLALADAEAMGAEGARPLVYLTDDNPVLLEDYDDVERERRAILQRLSREDARAAGIEIRSDWPGPEAWADLVEQGNAVQLLIDEVPMHDEEIPHWVTAFAVARTAGGERALVVQDPWVDAEHGETWVDSDQLPITLADIELMARFGSPAYRSAIVVPR